MTKIVRAKFRCMHVTESWDGKRVYEFLAVKRDGDRDSENSRFWDATPAGEAKLIFNTAAGAREFDVGAYYYLDMAADDDGGAWTLERKTVHEAQVDVHLATKPMSVAGLRWGTVDMAILNPDAFADFDAPGRRWRVDFVLAEASDGVEA